MLRKYLIGFFILFPLFCHTQNTVEQFYEAFNQKNWAKVKSLIDKDLLCITNNQKGASKQEFYDNLYRNDVWFAEWKILSMTETAENKFLINGTFTDEYYLFLYGAPVEGKWVYTVGNNGKIVAIKWLDFPENPNQERGDQREKEFHNWCVANHPADADINRSYSQQYALKFRDMLREYIKTKGE